MSTLYNRILSLTKEQNISGVALGKMIGLRKSPLTDWKNGKSEPTLEQVIKICEIFAISSDFLLFGSIKHDLASLSSDESELVNTYKKLDRRGKTRVNNTIYEELDRIDGAMALLQKTGRPDN